MVVWPLKDHEVARLVNELRDIAVKYHNTQQLRERIVGVVVPVLKPEVIVIEDIDNIPIRTPLFAKDGLSSAQRSSELGWNHHSQAVQKLIKANEEVDRLKNELAAARQDAATAWERHAMANRLLASAQKELADMRSSI